MGANVAPGGAPNTGKSASARQKNNGFMIDLRTSTSAQVRTPMPVDGQLRVGSDKRIPHVAGEADRRRGRQRLRQSVGWNLAPLHGNLIGTEDRRFCSGQRNFANRLSAGNAAFAGVPSS